MTSINRPTLDTLGELIKRKSVPFIGQSNANPSDVYVLETETHQTAETCVYDADEFRKT